MLASMLTLGIDTAGRQACVALLDEGDCVGHLGRSGQHSSVLLTLVEELLSQHGVAPLDLDLVGVSRGPGSYTGLRVGVVTAKTLGWASGAAVHGVPTLASRASQAPSGASRVLVALHAYKKRMLYVWFERVETSLRQVGEPLLVQAVEVPAASADAVVVTDAPELLVDLDSWGSLVVSTANDAAVAVAESARQMLTDEPADETYSLSPRYLRPPSVTMKPGQVPRLGKVQPRRGRSGGS